MNKTKIQELFLDLPKNIQGEISYLGNKIRESKEEITKEEETIEEVVEEVEEEIIEEYDDFFFGLEDIDEDYEVDLSEYEDIANKGEYLSDVISKEYIENLKSDQIEFISSDTGTGKSTFAKEVVGEVAKERGRKVLILSHRKVLKGASAIDTQDRNKEGLVVDRTYHSIMNERVDLSNYEFIICDEVHFLLKDSCFINFTDDILYKLLKVSKTYNIKLIMLTATPKGLKEAIQEKVDVKINHLDLTTRDFVNIDEVKLGYNMASMEFFIDEELKKGHKGIVYINNKESLLDLYLMDKYKNRSMFVCSSYSGKYYTQYVDKEKLDYLNKEQKFPEDVDLIFTTGILSDGVNIKDRDYRFLAMKEFSETPIVQTIGRKRFNRNNYKLEDWEKLNLFFLNYNGNQFHKEYIERLAKRVQVRKDHENLTYKEFFKKYRKDTNLDNKSLYLSNEGLLTYNEFNSKQAELLLQEIEIIAVVGYKKYIEAMLGGHKVETIDGIKQLKGDKELLALLERIKNEKLYTIEDRQELIETMNVRKNGRIMRSRKVLNSVLEEAKIPYRIEKCKREDKFINGKRRYFNGIWRVVSTETEIEITQSKKVFAKKHKINLNDDLLYRKDKVDDFLGALYEENIPLLTKKEKDTFAQYLGAKYNGRIIKGFSKINKALTLIESDFRFETFSTSRIVDGEKKAYNSAWRVVKA